MTFNLKTLEFTFMFKNDPTIIEKYTVDNGSLPLSLSPSSPSTDKVIMVAPEAEIYIPNYHYRKLLLDIRVSDGDWRYVKSRQTLYWRVKDWTTEGITHTLRIRVIDKADEINEKEDTLLSSSTT